MARALLAIASFAGAAGESYESLRTSCLHRAGEVLGYAGTLPPPPSAPHEGVCLGS